ncbi:hypothetical protein AGLY_015319 [Aphis glycines]|uniref:Uncharacterized protein n=1 Tax=Aphis glycines TaxID=307491 RepID=A0A6G0T0V4_APHGL|nr:hypothetical protein AGLY_015319 [Aphis glycines]
MKISTIRVTNSISEIATRYASSTCSSKIKQEIKIPDIDKSKWILQPIIFAIIAYESQSQGNGLHFSNAHEHQKCTAKQYICLLLENCTIKSKKCPPPPKNKYQLIGGVGESIRLYSTQLHNILHNINLQLTNYSKKEHFFIYTYFFLPNLDSKQRLRHLQSSLKQVYILALPNRFVSKFKTLINSIIYYFIIIIIMSTTTDSYLKLIPINSFDFKQVLQLQQQHNRPHYADTDRSAVVIIVVYMLIVISKHVRMLVYNS